MTVRWYINIKEEFILKKVAFITGGGGYIGGETAFTLSRAGFKVAVCDLNEAAIDKTVARIKEAGGEAKGYIGDVTDPKNIESVMRQAVSDLGTLGAMVHVAGGSARIAGKDATPLPLVEQEEQVIDTVLKVNLFGAFWASRAAAKIMMDQRDGGKIVNFSSVVAYNGLSGFCDYAASKGGVISLTKALAKELGPYKINVNSVAPGVVCRDEVDTTTEEGHHYAYETNVLGKKCTASDIANVVEFLVSDKSNFVTGQVYVCDGGRSLSMKGSD